MRSRLLNEKPIVGVAAMLLILFGAVAFVLLIACTNVSSLLLARAAGARDRFLDRKGSVGVERHAPPGQLGARGVEIGLARSCSLLEIFESVYRSGQVHEIHQMFRPGVPSVAELRGTASEAVLTELAALADQLRTLDALGALRRLAGDPPAGEPLGIAAPAFVNHWADGDLVVGSTLLDVKTVLKTGDRPRATQWLWQLVAYAWLDVADRYRIRDVGFYFARHGVLVTWPLDDLVDQLLDGGDRADARREFDRVAARVIAAEGARLPN